MAKIVPYNMVCRQLPGFKPSKAAAISRIIKQKNGRVIGIEHPLDCLKKKIFDGRLLSKNYYTDKSMSHKNYDSYIGRLERYASRENGIIFLFTGSEGSVVNWVQGINTNASFILVRTTKFSPVPSFPEHATRAARWKVLASTLMDLGVSRFELAGETDFKIVTNSSIDGKITEIPDGCVNIARENLAWFAQFITVDIAEPLTFPNVRIYPKVPVINKP